MYVLREQVLVLFLRLLSLAETKHVPRSLHSDSTGWLGGVVLAVVSTEAESSSPIARKVVWEENPQS